LEERQGTVDIITLLQQNWLRWYGHVSRKGLVKCMDYEVGGGRPSASVRPNKTWRDCEKRLSGLTSNQGGYYELQQMEEIKDIV